MNAPLTLAVVGAGMGSAPHFAALADLASASPAGARVAWVCGRDPQRLQAAQARPDWPVGAKPCTDLQQALDDPAVDAVLVLTPPDTHRAVVEQAARAGKHVLVEKPLAASLAEAQALVDTCALQGVRLAVMLQHRLRPASLALAELLADGSLGNVTSASASVRWWRPQSYYDVPGRGTLARDGGGVLMTQAIHTLDLLLQFTGAPVEVRGFATTSRVHRMECEDTAVAILRFTNGAVATVDATTAAAPGYPECITLNGTRGSATLQAGGLHVWVEDGAGGWRELRSGATHASGAGANPMAFDHAPHRAVIADFLQAIEQDREPQVSGASALLVQRVIGQILGSVP
jgi:UDP-N-acetyl-2-amino-2-deoxyglucuronate dehydrogenase